MCGIAGIVGRVEFSKNMIDQVSESIAHRGPDGRGEWVEGGICLIHRRLSVQDIAGGVQPMQSRDGRYIVVFNGEIYNFPLLKSDLAKAGVSFSTNCDTEVLLHLYERYGRDMVCHLRGMFAFAIWDRPSRTLFMARDHIGQKPLFYHHNGGTFIFGSEIKALFATGLVPVEPNLESLWHHTSLRFCPGEMTLFQGIQKVMPGHTLEYNTESGQLKTDRYWQLDYTKKTSLSLPEAIEQGYDLIQRVVREHLISDVPVGSFLSGGVDSSLVAALAQQSTLGQLKTFCIGSGDSDFSELPYAREASDLLRSEHHEFHVESNLMKLLPDLVWHLEEPGDPHAVGLYQLSQLTRQYLKVALGGDGGDEVFGGYTRYTQSPIVTAYSGIPAWLRDRVCAPLIGMLPESFGYYSVATKARWVHEMSSRSGAAQHYHAMSFFRFPEDLRDRLFSTELRARLGKTRTLQFVAEHYDSDAAEERVDRMLYAEQMTRMPEHYLLIADRMSMAHGLESRVPLVDRDVLEFSATLPPTYKIQKGKLKYILREIAGKHYSREYLYRTKQGFGFPMARWFRGELRAFISQTMEQSEVVKAGIFDGEFVNRIISEHGSGRVDHNFRIWMILNIEVWYRMFILGHGKEVVRNWIDEALAA